MTRLIDDRTISVLERSLGELVLPVRVVLFTQRITACATCRERRHLLEEVVALSDKLSLEVRNLVADASEARRLPVVRVPTTAVIGERDFGVHFVGETAGSELESLVEAISLVSEGSSGLGPELLQLVAMIDEPLHLQSATRGRGRSGPAPPLPSAAVQAATTYRGGCEGVVREC